MHKLQTAHKVGGGAGATAAAFYSSLGSSWRQSAVTPAGQQVYGKPRAATKRTSQKYIVKKLRVIEILH